MLNIGFRGSLGFKLWHIQNGVFDLNFVFVANIFVPGNVL